MGLFHLFTVSICSRYSSTHNALYMMFLLIKLAKLSPEGAEENQLHW